ncbi:hypothetical protein W7K_21225 [Stenotrophomonas geniculata N1]|uniref:Uncharacterized protein n=1 Tax=Stenotrophomonas geniculata N1 TaxID=1167641 RepID=A0A0L8A4M1_9GAMM|nr:hypothetical protein W7K_21225 [Stenotrophomonas geniculata N1]
MLLNKVSDVVERLLDFYLCPSKRFQIILRRIHINQLSIRLCGSVMGVVGLSISEPLSNCGGE